MTFVPAVPIIPASYFGIVLGIAGLGSAWHVATRAWHVPASIGDALDVAGLAIWMVVATLYLLKWVVAGERALEEIRDPVQSCFVGLAGVATMLAAGMALPCSHIVAETLFALGAAYSLGFSVWFAGDVSKGGRREGFMSPALYLPAVAGCLVTAIQAGSLGYSAWAQTFLGAGLFSWLAIESVVLHRLVNFPAMPPAIRPTLGLMLAPPSVAAVAYLGATSGRPDVVAHALTGYAVFQGLIIVRLLPWILEEAFSISYWAFSFGGAALATASVRLVERGDTEGLASIAPVLFIVINLATGLLAIGTIHLLATGRVKVEWVPIGSHGSKQPIETERSEGNPSP